MNAKARASLQFVRHPWPFPSSLSLLGCYARVNLLEPRQVAAQFRLQPVADALGFLDRAQHYKIAPELVESTLQLSPGELSLAFDARAWWPKAFRSLYTTFAGAPRFCLGCLTQGYHTRLFDLPWVVRCPVHALKLCDACPRCGGWLRGLASTPDPREPFSCSKCGADFADTGAIVMAARAQGTVWNDVVAAHFRWCRQVSDGFLVAPTYPGENVEPDTEFLHSLINVSGAVWPRALAPWITTSDAKPKGPSLSLPVSTARVGARLRHLSGFLADASVGIGDEFHLTLEQSRWLLALEQRLQRASGVYEPRILSSDLHYARRWVKLKGLTRSENATLSHPKFDKDFNRIIPAPKSVRGLGYSYRSQTVHVGTNLAGQTHYSVVKGDLSGLVSVRLLAGTYSMRRNLAAQDSRVVDRILAWWYQHLLAVSLVDCTAAAIHKTAWLLPERSPEPEVLPGWPTVDLDRHPPGRSWILTAAGGNGRWSAYLIPVLLRRQRPGQFKSTRDLTITMVRTAEVARWLNRKDRNAPSAAN